MLELFLIATLSLGLVLILQAWAAARERRERNARLRRATRAHLY